MAHPIFLYWHQGWDKAPELVQRCAESWEIHHNDTDWEVHLLDRANIQPWLSQGDPEDWKALRRFEKRFNAGDNVGGLNNFANLLRLALLDCYGGVWADATTLCFQPLDSWLPTYECLGMPRSGATNRRTETWFIDNRSKDPLLRAWKERYRNQYFSPHNEVEYLDNWNTRHLSISYILLNVGMRSKGLAARIWNSHFALNILKRRPYFATNHVFEKILREALSKDKSLPLHELILPIDTELVIAIHQMALHLPLSPFAKSRLNQAGFTKLSFKKEIPDLRLSGKHLEDCAWKQLLEHAQVPH